MNRIARRSVAMLLFVAILLGGVGFFLVEYVLHADEWVIRQGSPHVYSGPNLGCGLVTDRSGILLMDTTGDRTYSTNDTLRKSTLHWLGDHYGYISAPALPHYAEEMAGFDRINGVYSYSGGGHATLTLSAQVQMAALEAMGDYKGTVAVYNYKTGEILCAVTTPTYDPDNVPDMDTAGAYEGVYMNRFTQSVYIPGSIFKAVTAAAALECIPDILEQTFVCDGVREYGVDAVTCLAAHGEQDLYDAMANSCNCAFAEISEQIGAQRLQEYVDRFGVTKSVAFDGVTTASGNFDVSGAAAVQLAWSGIGQHKDQINPCAFLTYMGTIANGGSVVKPHLVSRVTCGNRVTYEASADPTDPVMSARTAQVLQEMMRNNVVEKYGADDFPGLTVCAKSGTAEVGGDLKSNAMFAGFVMDAEYPLAFIVTVEGGGYGRPVCMPIIAEILAVCKEMMDQK